MILLVHLLSNEKNKFTNKHYTMVLLAKSVYYKYFFKNKKNIHGIKKTLKTCFYRKIKHIKYVLNNYGANVDILFSSP